MKLPLLTKCFIFFLQGRKIYSALYQIAHFILFKMICHWENKSTFLIIVFPSLTYTIILHLEIECQLHTSFITKNFGNSHSLLMSVVSFFMSLEFQSNSE